MFAHISAWPVNTDGWCGALNWVALRFCNGNGDEDENENVWAL